MRQGKNHDHSEPYTRDAMLCNCWTRRRNLTIFVTWGDNLLLKSEYLFAADPGKCSIVLRGPGSCR